jgi:hypothetical protein
MIWPNYGHANFFEITENLWQKLTKKLAFYSPNFIPIFFVSRIFLKNWENDSCGQILVRDEIFGSKLFFDKIARERNHEFGQCLIALLGFLLCVSCMPCWGKIAFIVLWPIMVSFLGTFFKRHHGQNFKMLKLCTHKIRNTNTKFIFS